MDDLISRQAAIDALHMHLMYRMGTDSNKKRLDDWINSLPSAQPEIIRCKDCKYREYYRESGYMCRLDTGDPYMTGRNAEDDDWFCADAERRTDEHTD